MNRAHHLRLSWLPLAALSLALAGCGNKAEDSRQQMHKLQGACMDYATKNKGVWPDKLDQIKDQVGGDAGLAKLMANPLTGDNPGYEYVKPQGTFETFDRFADQIVLYQLKGGKRDTSLKVGYAGGAVRPYETPPAAAEWKEFKDTAVGFSLLMPGSPQIQSKDETLHTGKSKFTFLIVEVPLEGSAYVCIHNDYPPGTQYGEEAFAHKVLEATINGVAEASKTKAGKMTKVTLDGHHGLESRLEPKDGKASLLRAYLIGNRMVQLRAVWRDGGPPADAEKFVGSFKLTK